MTIKLLMNDGCLVVINNVRELIKNKYDLIMVGGKGYVYKLNEIKSCEVE